MEVLPGASRVRAALGATWGRALALGVAFLALQRISARFLFEPLRGSAVWLPAGVSLAFLLRSPLRMWPALLTAVLGVEFGIAVAQGFPSQVGLLWGLGNALRMGLGAVLMRQVLGTPVLLIRVREVAGLLVLGSLVAALPSATLGALASVQWLQSPSFWREWVSWWLSDALGTVLVAPVLLTWWPLRSRVPRLASGLEVGLVVAVAVLVTAFLFRQPANESSPGILATLPYAAFPVVITAALRMGPRGAATVAAMMGSVAIWYTSLGLGPFGTLSVDSNEQVLSVQTFLAVLTLSGLTLAAVAAERSRAEKAQRVLAQAGAVLGESLDWRGTLPRVLELLVPELCDGAALWLMRPDRTMEPLASAGTCSARPLDPSLSEFNRSWRGPGGSGLVAPMWTGGQVVGALTVCTGPASPPLGQGAQALAEDLARRCAQALERARLFDEAREAIAARDEFIAIAAHEMRTPLAALTLRVHGLEARLRRPDVPDEVRDKVQLLARQVSRLTQLVENLLDVGRINTGRLELRRESMDLSELVLEVVERFRDAAARAGCELRASVAPRLMGTWDRARLEQALTNLLANAIKFGAGQPVEVSLAREGERRVRLQVCDHGIGVPEDALERIFGRFERAVSSRRYGGLGLGLFLTRQIAEAHGGTVSASSQPGQGACFVLELPLES
ncbi:MASE1 domain-containing protein [Myxococcaceae bacterium JPH2]|nr:MASE1 domain-containing protein [Myxococcaceae bacterium JPH2]